MGIDSCDRLSISALHTSRIHMPRVPSTGILFRTLKSVAVNRIRAQFSMVKKSC